jgi:hypothetical protein
MTINGTEFSVTSCNEIKKLELNTSIGYISGVKQIEELIITNSIVDIGDIKQIQKLTITKSVVRFCGSGCTIQKVVSITDSEVYMSKVDEIQKLEDISGSRVKIYETKILKKEGSITNCDILFKDVHILQITGG